MSADLWMGIAIGSVSPWILMLGILRGRRRFDKEAGDAQSRTENLLEDRNKIGRLQVSVLQEIQHRLEGIFDRMPETEATSPAWIGRRVYKDSDEGKKLLDARFKPTGRSSEAFFPFDGHNWRYSFTSFDDKGEYDQIERPNEGKEGK